MVICKTLWWAQLLIGSELLTNSAHCQSTIVPTTGFYIVPVDWKSNSTPNKPKKNLCSSYRTKVMLTLVFCTIYNRKKWENLVGNDIFYCLYTYFWQYNWLKMIKTWFTYWGFHLKFLHIHSKSEEKSLLKHRHVGCLSRGFGVARIGVESIFEFEVPVKRKIPKTF